MNLLLDHTTIVTLAILGGIASALPATLKGHWDWKPETIRLWTVASYLFMAASVILFVTAGFIGVTPGTGA